MKSQDEKYIIWMGFKYGFLINHIGTKLASKHMTCSCGARHRYSFTYFLPLCIPNILSYLIDSYYLHRLFIYCYRVYRKDENI